MRHARNPSPPAPRSVRSTLRPLAFSRLRTAHDSTLRNLVTASWDMPSEDPVHSWSSPFLHEESPPPSIHRSQQLRFPHRHHYPSSSEQPSSRPSLPPRAATDVSGAAMHAARLAELAARDAAEASAAARAAASYARTLFDADRAASRAAAAAEAAADTVANTATFINEKLEDRSTNNSNFVLTSPPPSHHSHRVLKPHSQHHHHSHRSHHRQLQYQNQHSYFEPFEEQQKRERQEQSHAIPTTSAPLQTQDQPNGHSHHPPPACPQSQPPTSVPAIPAVPTATPPSNAPSNAPPNTPSTAPSTAPSIAPPNSSTQFPPLLDGRPRPILRKIRTIVRPVPIGKVWSFDLIALPHNAIRMEMRDLDEIVWGLVDGPRPPNLHELSAFFAWFSTFEAFVVTCLKAEEEVLFPWVEQWGRIEGQLSTASRITTKGSIFRGIRDTVACAALIALDGQIPGMVLTNPHRNYYDSLKVGLAEVKPSINQQQQQNNASHVNQDNEDSNNDKASKTAKLHASVVERIASLVESFSNTMLDYFHEQERSLPVIIDSLFDEEDMHSAGIERRIIRAIWKCGRKDESMVILMRAIEDTPLHRQWLQRNLRRLERFALPLWKRKYSIGRGAVTAKFRQRNLFWEHNASFSDGAHLVENFHSGGTPPRHSSSTNLSFGLYRLSQPRSVESENISNHFQSQMNNSSHYQQLDADQQHSHSPPIPATASQELSSHFQQDQ